MKEETLEEAAERYAEKVFNERPNLDNDSKIWLVGGSTLGFTEGAKWQQERSYSEEEVIDILLLSYSSISDRSLAGADLRKWFEQFKKK
jgi:hypothetical protein